MRLSARVDPFMGSELDRTVDVDWISVPILLFQGYPPLVKAEGVPITQRFTCKLEEVFDSLFQFCWAWQSKEMMLLNWLTVSSNKRLS